jgi:hypothetical protein
VLWAFSIGVKLPDREADHSLSSSAEVKNEWSYNSTPQYAFMVELKKDKNKFTLLYFTVLFTNPCVTNLPNFSLKPRKEHPFFPI